MITTPNATIASASGTSRAAPGGRSFWAVTRTAITAIQPTLITPSTTSTAISPALEPTQHSPNPDHAIQPTLITPSTTSTAISPAPEPTQHSPNPKPDPAVSRQQRRKCRLSGVNS